MFDYSQLQLRNSSYSEPAASEICAALLVLARHGALGVGLGAALGAAQVFKRNEWIDPAFNMSFRK